MRERGIELLVGVFVLLAIICLVVLAFKVSGLTQLSQGSGYQVTAQFEDIGGLKIRAPVTVSGVSIGQVTNIQLDKETFKAVVTMNINATQSLLPSDTSASIYTEGLLGSNYISLMPGYAETYLKNGSEITTTHSALILEKLIGQLLFNVKK